MTALTEYDRLEAPGLWRSAPDAQRRDVFVSMGDATLSIYDGAERPLAHWSLPAVERQNPGGRPALYAPGPDASESLEIDDDTMIDAFDRLQRSIERRRPRQGRVRVGILSVASLCLAALLVFWLPGALDRHAVAVMPPAVRAETGERLLAHVIRITGGPCGNGPASRALAALADRVLGPFGGTLVVVPGGVAEAAHLPGGIVLLNRALMEDHDSAEPAAGYILAEIARAGETDPMERLLGLTGPRTAFHLLTQGEIPEAALEGYAETLLTEPAAPLPIGRALALFEAARIGATPYAYARDATGETTQALIDGDPVPPDAAEPVLSDGEWVALQSICGD